MQNQLLTDSTAGSLPVATMELLTLKGLKLGFAITGSHCTIAESVKTIKRLKEQGVDIFPIVSESVRDCDTKFGEAAYWRAELTALCGRLPIDSIVLAEPIGPQSFFDALVIAPCSGNTIAKLANGITDTPVLMAAKAHLRNLKPLVLAVSTNDGLSANARNIGLLLNTKNIYFVPLGQDNPDKKANSLLAQFEKIPVTIEQALLGKQIQPLLVEYK